MGLAAATIGAIGSVLGTGTIGSAISVVVGSAISGALIGAAVGGLSALVMGGDIGKGILNGAVGGAVLGGVMGVYSVFTQGAEGAFTAATATTAEGSAATTSTKLTAPKTSTITTKTYGTDGALTGTKEVISPATESGFLGMSDSTMQVVGKTLGGAATGYLSKTDAPDIGEQTAAQATLTQQQLDAQAAESAKDRKARMDELNVQLASQMALDREARGEQRRQFDVTQAAELARQRDAASGRGALTIGQGTDTTAVFDPKLTGDLLQTGVLEEEY